VNHRLWFGLSIAVGLTAGFLRAAEPTFDTLTTEYTRDVRPLLQRHCGRCHSETRQEAEINLEQFATLADVRKAPKTWQYVMLLV
jgi:hypothetical protein